jgi:glycosyltransferase 2 family protein
LIKFEIHENRKKLLKIIFSFLLISFLIIDLEYSLILHAFSSFNWYRAGYTIFILCMSLFLYPFKWWMILKFSNLKYSFKNIFNLNLVSSFYNMVLPTRIGGDFVKFFILAKTNKKNKEKIASTIIIDRLFNFFAIIMILVSSIIYRNNQHNETLFLQLFLLTIFIFSIIYLLPNVSFLLKHKIFSRNKIIKSIVVTLESVSNILNTFRKNSFIITTSFINVLTTFYISYNIGHSIGIDLNFNYYLYFLSLTSIATIVPISFGGFGVREGSFVYFLSLMDVPKELALSLSLLSYLFMIIPSFFGFLISNILNIKYDSN